MENGTGGIYMPEISRPNIPNSKVVAGRAPPGQVTLLTKLMDVVYIY